MLLNIKIYHLQLHLLKYIRWKRYYKRSPFGHVISAIFSQRGSTKPPMSINTAYLHQLARRTRHGPTDTRHRSAARPAGDRPGPRRAVAPSRTGGGGGLQRPAEAPPGHRRRSGSCFTARGMMEWLATRAQITRHRSGSVGRRAGRRAAGAGARRQGGNVANGARGAGSWWLSHQPEHC